MRGQKILFVLTMAFLFAMVSCEGKGAGAYEDPDDYSLEDGSSSSNKTSSSSKDDSSSSRNGSSSSEEDDSSDNSSSSSSDLSRGSSSSESSSGISSDDSSEESSESSSSAQAETSSSISYEDLPGKVIEGEYQGYIGHVVSPTIEVRALTEKLEYVDSTVSYEGRMDSSKYVFDVRGLPEDIRYAEIHIRVNDASHVSFRYYVDQYAVVDLKDVDFLYVNSAMDLIYKRIKYLVGKKDMTFADAKAQAESELAKAFNAEAEFHNLETIDLLVNASPAGLWAASVATLESIMYTPENERAGSGGWKSFPQALQLMFWSDDFVTEGTVVYNDEFLRVFGNSFFNCSSWSCSGDIVVRSKNRESIQENLIAIMDAVSGRGTCTSERVGDVFEVAYESFEPYDYYTCDGTAWNKSTVMEKDLYKLGTPACDEKKIVMGESTREYYCDGAGTWIEASPWTTEVPLEFRFNEKVKYGTMTDPRDGQTYRTVKIGNKEWMAQNLNFKGYANKADEDSSIVANMKGENICYEKKETNCDLCGRLYSWVAAMNINGSLDTTEARAMIEDPHQGICPDGWHIPNEGEFKYMITEYYNKNTDKMGEWLKAKRGWGIGYTDPVGFTALPCGESYNGKYKGMGDHAYFIATSQYRLRLEVSIYTSFKTLGFENNNDRGSLHSVRCVKND